MKTRVTGGGVGQFCSSLWSLQLKLPSHLGQFISIFTLGFVKIVVKGFMRQGDETDIMYSS